MAFRRYANAVVTHPLASQAGWERVRRAGGVRVASASKDLVAQASGILGGRLDPDRYMLSHATIVCSVDTDPTPNVRLGKVDEGGQTVNRRWGSYLITPNCSKYVNNNGDAWTRPVLMKSYRTFVGAHNFLEHVQVEDLSKGRIIDAVPRDVGESLYIDILVATDRRHTDLVADIESGKMGAMSMGCFLPGTQVSLADGRRIAIEDVVPGEMVLTHKGRAREVLNKQIRHGRWGIRRINAVGVPSEIVATDNHPFFVLRAPDVCGCGCGEPLPASKSTRTRSHRRDMTRRFLRGHDKRVFNPKAVYSLDEHRARQERLAEIGRPRLVEVRADELRVGDMLCFPRPSYVGNDAGVGRAHARLLGYFLAEGSFLKHKGDAVGVEFSFALTERDTYAAEVCDLFRQAFPESNPRVYEREDRNTTAVQVSGRDIASWFRTHGGEYCHGKRMSAEAMSWSSDLHLDIIGAWLNGDGTLAKSGQTAGVTTSYDLACQMHMLMARCGVFARIEARVGSKSVDVRDVVGGVPVRDEVTGKLPWYTVTVGRLESAAFIGRTDKVASASDQGRMMHVSDDHIQFKVTSVGSDAYTGWVYDMEVDEDHSYVVEGVAVHNCNVEHTTCTKCGNVAVDETEMCEHVKYQKLNKYFDNTGKQRIIAELCFPPGTRIVMGDGTRRPIEDLQVGDVVFSHQGRRREITRTFTRRHVGPVVALDVVGIPQTIRSTPNHPYWVLSPRSECACGCGTTLDVRGDGGRGDLTRTFAPGHNPNNKGADNTSLPAFQFKDASELRKGDMLALPAPTEVISPPDVDENRAWILGWFLAEGNYLKSGGRKVGVQFTLNADDGVSVAEEIAAKLEIAFPPEHDQRRGITENILRILDEGSCTSGTLGTALGRSARSLHNVLTKLAQEGIVTRRPLTSAEKDALSVRRRGVTYLWGAVPGADRSILTKLPHVYRYERAEGGFKLVVCYNHIGAAAWFEKHAGEYAADKRLSPDAVLWPVPLQRELLRGYVNGDGGADELDRFNVSSISETLISQMQIVAARCGLWTRRQVVFGGKCVELMDVVGGGAVPTDDRGWRPLHSMSFQPSDDTTLAFAGSVGRVRGIAPAWRNHGMLMLYRVRDVTRELYAGPVHNLEVAADHSYLVEGLAAHNCGHETEDPTAGVTFIEASWVANPAFTGAVMRNILSPTEVSPDTMRQARTVLAAPPKRWVASPNARAAKSRVAEDPVFDFSQFQDGGADKPTDEPATDKPADETAPNEPAAAEPAPAVKTPAKPSGNTDLDEPVDRLFKEVLERVENRVRDTLKGKPSPTPEASTSAPNDNVVKEASARTAARRVYASAVRDIVATSATDIDVVERVASLDRSLGFNAPVTLYRTVLRVGATSRYHSESSYLSACADALGRPPDQTEADALVRVGRILTHHAGAIGSRIDHPAARSQR